MATFEIKFTAGKQGVGGVWSFPNNEISRWVEAIKLLHHLDDSATDEEAIQALIKGMFQETKKDLEKMLRRNAGKGAEKSETPLDVSEE